MRKSLIKKMHCSHLTEKVIGWTIGIYRELAPESLQSAYHRCLGHESCLQGINSLSLCSLWFLCFFLIIITGNTETCK